MFAEARLVTPEGKTIVLSMAEYHKVVEALSLQAPLARPSPDEARSLAHELRGKYAAGPSLTQALLNERRKEREREENRIRRHDPRT
jgi:hypothetical protein